jgi:hypothetical protein
MYNIIIENSPTNFGHQNLIIQSNIKSINSSDPINPIKLNYSKLYEYNNHLKFKDTPDSNTYDQILSYINKHEELKSVPITYPDSKIYFELKRYCFKNEQNDPNYTTGPTLSISLFMPNDQILTGKFDKWIQKYFSNQIRIVLVFKYFFPDCNIRIYLDHYMLEGFNKKWR